MATTDAAGAAPTPAVKAPAPVGEFLLKCFYNVSHVKLPDTPDFKRDLEPHITEVKAKFRFMLKFKVDKWMQDLMSYSSLAAPTLPEFPSLPFLVTVPSYANPSRDFFMIFDWKLFEGITLADLKTKFEGTDEAKKNQLKNIPDYQDYELAGKNCLFHMASIWNAIVEFWFANIDKLDLSAKPDYNTPDWSTPEDMNAANEKLLQAVKQTLNPDNGAWWGHKPGTTEIATDLNYWTEKINGILEGGVNKKKQIVKCAANMKRFTDSLIPFPIESVNFSRKDHTASPLPGTLAHYLWTPVDKKSCSFTWNVGMEPKQMKNLLVGKQGYNAGSKFLAKVVKAEADKAKRSLGNEICVPTLVQICYPDLEADQQMQIQMMLAKGGVTTAHELVTLGREEWIQKGLPIGVWNRMNCELDIIFEKVYDLKEDE